jgi:hypothetical protein
MDYHKVLNFRLYCHPVSTSYFLAMFVTFPTFLRVDWGVIEGRKVRAKLRLAEHEKPEPLSSIHSQLRRWTIAFTVLTFFPNIML